MPKETIDKKPVSLPEVVSIFNKRKKAGELNYLQRIALEHAQRSSKVTGKQAKSLIKKLMTEFELSEHIAISIVNFMPETLDELRVFIQDASRVYTTEEVESMLDLLRE
jgi:DNA-directed RNA polymerase subunit F